MKFIMTRRDGTPIYEDYRLKVADDEETRIKYMMTMAFRCQRGSELIPTYGFDSEAVVADEMIIRMLTMQTLDNQKFFPGVSSFSDVNITVSGSTAYISFNVNTSEGETIPVGVSTGEL